jgi:cyanophycin synthetase
VADGGRAVFVEGGTIILAEGHDRNELVELDRIPFTMGGAVRFQVMNALAATTAAWGAGLNPALIARALTTFEVSTETVPGRFNVMERNGVQIILDYAHNTEAMRALSQAVQAMGVKRTVMLVTLPGDRPTADLLETFAQTVPFVDEYVLYDSYDRRGRAEGEIPKLLAENAADGIPAHIVTEWKEAIRYAATRVSPGDRLVVIADVVDDFLEQLPQLSSQIGSDAACLQPISGHSTAAQ